MNNVTNIYMRAFTILICEDSQRQSNLKEKKRFSQKKERKNGKSYIKDFKWNRFITIFKRISCPAIGVEKREKYQFFVKIFALSIFLSFEIILLLKASYPISGASL